MSLLSNAQTGHVGKLRDRSLIASSVDVLIITAVESDFGESSQPAPSPARVASRWRILRGDEVPDQFKALAKKIYRVGFSPDVVLVNNCEIQVVATGVIGTVIGIEDDPLGDAQMKYAIVSVER